MDLQFPIHLQSPSDGLRRNRDDTICSIRSRYVPRKCFIHIDDLNKIPVYVACPEYCFLNAATHLSFPELIQFGYSLCAKYVPDPDADYGQRARVPLTNVSNITRFLSFCDHAHGDRNARRAVKHILDNSNSPMETKLAMAAVLPFLQGGFALKHLEMNRYVALTPQGRALLGIDSCCCDMVWDQEKIILEYDSNLTHLEARQHAMDKKRASALSMAGCKVISITADVLHNFTAFEKTFLSLRWTLGMRTDQHRFASCRRQRYDLYQFLLRH